MIEPVKLTSSIAESTTNFPDNVGEAAGTFARFASVAEQVRATTKRTEKAVLLGSYFTSLSDKDLLLAARYFAGYTFPLRDQRKINIGGAALLKAIAAVTGAEVTTLQATLVKLGDLGDVAAEILATSASVQQQPILTLRVISSALEQLAETTGTKRKIVALTDLLSLATPLEAKYVVKLCLGDLRIGLKESAVEDAIAHLFAIDVSRVQWANMLIGDIGEIAVLARYGRLDEARMQLFHPIKFMLASPAADLTEVAKQMPSEFAVEDKYDGIRAQAHIAPEVDNDSILHGTVYDDIRIALFSRTLDEITLFFPDLLQSLATLSKSQGASLLLDGEIVPIQGQRILSFQKLQTRLGRKTLSPELLTAVPVAFIVYDVLYIDGRVLLNESFATRRRILEFLHLDSLTVRRAGSQRFPDISGLDAEFAAARARGNEGLMVKDPSSPYKPGRRGRDWLKIKRPLATLDVVVTAVEVGNGKRHHLLSDYTFAVRAGETDNTLLNVGKAYSGLTDAEIAELSEWFRAHTIQQFAHGQVYLVEPRIVLEVTFDRVQVSQRYKSGFALRFPRIVRVRHDKPVAEIDTLDVVRRLAESNGEVAP